MMSLEKLHDRSERGAIAIEYALLAFLVAVGLAIAFTALRVDIAGVYTAVGSGIDAAVN